MSLTLSRYSRWLVTLAWVVAGGWLASATTEEVSFQLLVPPTPPEVTRDLVVRDAPDKAGLKTSFRILLFSDEFRWRLNSSNAIELDRNRPQFTEEMKAVLNKAQEVICVGASSEEIPAGVSFEAGRVQEERRAARRAEQIAVWVREALSRPIPVRKLNVGHHARTQSAAGDTSDQRRVVIILVLDHEEGANIDQSLRSAMAAERSRAPVFESLLTNYSLASRERFAWVP
jgi:hypothetical protein